MIVNLAGPQSVYERYMALIRADDQARRERREVFALLMRFRKVPDAGKK